MKVILLLVHCMIVLGIICHNSLYLLSSLINEQYPAPTSKKNIKNYIW